MSEEGFAYNSPALGKLIKHQVVSKYFFVFAIELKFYYCVISSDIYTNKFAFRFWRSCGIIFFCFFKIGDPLFDWQRLDLIVDHSQHVERWMKAFADILYIPAIVNSLNIGAVNN